MIQVKVYGAKEAQAYLLRLSREYPNAARRAEKKVAELIKSEGKKNLEERTFTRTGKLLSSIRVLPVGKDFKVEVFAPYAAVIEYGIVQKGWHFVAQGGYGKYEEGYLSEGGTHIIKARHFMRDAVDLARTRVVDIFEEELKKEVNNA